LFGYLVPITILGMDTDDLERLNEWNQPKTLGQMRERSGGTLSPQSDGIIAPQTKEPDPKRGESRQLSDQVRDPKPPGP